MILQQIRKQALLLIPALAAIFQVSAQGTPGKVVVTPQVGGGGGPSYTINGPDVVYYGTAVSYTLVQNGSPIAPIPNSWTASSSCATAVVPPDWHNPAVFRWDNSGCVNGTSTISALDWAGSVMASKTVNILPAQSLIAGSITSSNTNVTYNTTPPPIYTVAASQGSCFNEYVYQWQYSADNVSYTDFAGQTAYNLFFAEPVTQTRYYRRKVTCNGTTLYTNAILITVSPQLQPGSISPLTQSIAFDTIPAGLAGTVASGGGCGGVYQYQWQYSSDNITFENIDLDTSLSITFDQRLQANAYFRRKVTCGIEVAYTPSALVTVAQPFNGGVISSDNQTISAGTVPATINAGPAQNCGTTAVYQWQISGDGYNFTNLSGATGQNLTYTTPISRLTFFRRRAKCATLTAYTGTYVISIKTGALTFQPPLPNANDTLLQDGGININTIFGIQSDSVANFRRPANNPFASLDSSTALDHLLPTLSGFEMDSTVILFADTLSKVDLIDSILSINGPGGRGNDTAAVFSPFVDDNLIQLYRSTANYGALDSVINTETSVSVEEAYTQLTDSTAANCGGCNRSFIPVELPRLTKSITLSGTPVVQRDSVYRYYAGAHFPLQSTSRIMWNIRGGTIVGQNTDPASGAVYVDVRWNRFFGLPFISVFDWTSFQFGLFPIVLPNPLCKVYPALQTLYYGQQPTIMVATPCAGPAGTRTYQWQVLDVYGSGGWTDVVGATNVTYQAPGLTSPWLMYRLVTKIYNGATLLDTKVTSAASLQLTSLTGGLLATSTTSVAYNTSASVTATTPTGGYTPAGSAFSYTWEVSVNNAAWTSIGTGATFPGYTVIKSNTRFRRQVEITGVPATIPVKLRKAVSNEVKVNTFYQTADYENKNYFRENLVGKRGVGTWEEADGLGIDEKVQTTVYMDGLGKTIQVVGKGTHFDAATNQWSDLVQPVEYAAGGQPTKKYLPYPSATNLGKYKSNALTEQATYYTNTFGESYPYAELKLDGSPLNQIKTRLSPGASWVGEATGVTNDIEPYLATENVRYWRVGYNETDLPITTSVFPDLSLIKRVALDEEGKKLIQYSTPTGKVILEKVQFAGGPGLTPQHSGWLCTYYVYDDFDQLRFVITPKAVKELDETLNWTITQAIVDGLCFVSHYDEEGRVIAKKSPGKGIEYLVYDKRGRVVLSQDGGQRQKSPYEWSSILYDDYNRVVLTGIYKSNNTRAQLQTTASGAASVSAVYTTANGGDIRVWGAILSAAEINNTTNYEQLSFAYYDAYTFTGAQTFVSTQSFSYQGGQVETWSKTSRVLGSLVGTRTKVLDASLSTPLYLTNTRYYDEHGREIQKLIQNVKQGVDVYSVQYHFDGRRLSALETMNITGTSYTAFQLLTKYSFDKVGRVTKIAKKINNTGRSYVASTILTGSTEDADPGYKAIASFNYDARGQLIKKTLSPDYNSGLGLDFLEYSYTSRGWLSGINKTYALNEYAGDQWAHYFGLYIGYDNRDGKFTAARKDGLVTGVLWKSQGDNTPRRFNYVYDNPRRLLAANFTQKGTSAEAWNNTKVDFSTTDLAYDVNGNILSMRNKTAVPGGATAVMLDQLTYFYQANTNKLLRVDDASAGVGANGKLLDFKDGSNSAGSDDYIYDENGNITKDLNKNIKDGSGDGITYNFFNKPTKINVEGKGIVENIYDAAGAKVKTITTENASAANGNQVIKTTTTYIGAFVLQQKTIGATAQTEVVTMIRHEEGRIRLITPYINASDPSNEISGGITLLDGKQGVFDFEVRDHLSNIRAVLTEEINKASGVCTMEDANTSVKTWEESVFGNTTNNEVVATRDTRPSLWTSGTLPPLTLAENQKVSKLQTFTSTPKIGPNSLLRVMAGDKVRAYADYYYVQNPGSAAGNGNGLGAMIQSLGAALLGDKGTLLAKENVTAISTGLNGTTPLQTFMNNQPTTGTLTAPRAYLNYIFLDEQFNFVSQGSGFVRVSQSGNGASPLVLTEAKAPKNGYVYIYLSNESSEAVYFDNFSVSHERGRLIEEGHYYAYGLKIAGISSKALSNTLATKLPARGYQSSFNEEVQDLDLNVNEFQLRTYDPQLGRWTGADPYDEFASPYVGMANNPVSTVDPTGGFTGIFAGMTQAGKSAFMTVAGSMIGMGLDYAMGGDGSTGAIAGAAIGLGASFWGGAASIAQASTTATASIAVGIPAVMYDVNGMPTSQMPEELQRAFRTEYGIQLRYDNGMLTYAGDIMYGQKITPTGRNYFCNLLTTGATGTLVFGYNLGFIYAKQHIMTTPVDFAVHVIDKRTGKFYVLVDLADFEADMTLKSAQSQSRIPPRAMNLPRAIEHEYGHQDGYKDQEGMDDGTGLPYPGDVEHFFVNGIREELGVLLRSTYGNTPPGVSFGSRSYVNEGYDQPFGSRTYIYTREKTMSLNPARTVTKVIGLDLLFETLQHD